MELPSAAAGAAAAFVFLSPSGALGASWTSVTAVLAVVVVRDSAAAAAATGSVFSDAGASVAASFNFSCSAAACDPPVDAASAALPRPTAICASSITKQNTATVS